MSRSIAARLRRVVPHLRPSTCGPDGRHCRWVRLVGDGSEDPPVPDLPATCRHCGRPTEWQIVRLLGVDVTQL